MLCDTCDQTFDDPAVKIWNGKRVCPDCFQILYGADSDTPKVPQRFPPNQPTASNHSLNYQEHPQTKPSEVVTDWKTPAGYLAIGIGVLAFFSSAWVNKNIFWGLSNPLFYIGIFLGRYWLQEAKQIQKPTHSKLDENSSHQISNTDFSTAVESKSPAVDFTTSQTESVEDSTEIDVAISEDGTESQPPGKYSNPYLNPNQQGNNQEDNDIDYWFTFLCIVLFFGVMLMLILVASLHSEKSSKESPKPLEVKSADNDSAGLGSVEANHKRAIESLEKSQQLRKEGKLDEAIKEITVGLGFERNAGLYYWRAWFWYELEEPEKAISDFTEAITISDNPAVAYASRGSVRLSMYSRDRKSTSTHELESILADCNEAIRLNPNSPYAFAVRSEYYFLTSQYDVLIQDATQSISLDPGDGRAFRLRGMSWELKGNMTKAKADYKEAERLKEAYRLSNLNDD